MDEDKRLVEASLWERLAVTKTGSCSALVGKATVSTSVFPPYSGLTCKIAE